MGNLTAAQAVALTDKLAALALTFKPAVGTTLTNSLSGLGDSSLLITDTTHDYGAHRKANDLITYLLTLQDVDRMQDFLPLAIQTVKTFNWQNRVKNDMNQHFVTLSAIAGASGLSGVTDLNSFLSYYNVGGGGPFNALICPDFAAIYNIVQTNSPMLAINVYSPAINGMGTQAVGGGFTPGTSVDTTKYAGVAIAQIVVTSFAGSSGTVTVTGTNHLAQTGHTWTATVAANGTFTLTPTVTTDILTSVSGIAFAGSITAGSATVNGLIPASRSNPPV